MFPSASLRTRIWKKLMDTSDEWITQRSGIKERRWVTSEQNTTDLAYEATQIALQDAGVTAKDLDLIIFATLSADMFFPGSGVLLQDRLGIPGVPAIDIRQQCSGFVYGLSIADQYVKSGAAKNILLVGSEVHSKGLDKTTRGRDVTVLFGDGAGAAVIGVTDDKNKGVYSTHLHADGRGARNLCVPAPGSAIEGDEWLSPAILESGLQYPYMEGKKVFVEAVTRMSEVVLEGLKANDLTVSQIDLFFFHQANLRINAAVAQNLQIPPEKVFNTIEKFGNTTAATIPLGMFEAKKAGVLKPGMRVGLAAFGSGYTWGSAFLNY